MTGWGSLFRACDGKFWDEDLSEEGNAFADAYCSGEGGKEHGAYIEDCERTLAGGLRSTYHVEDMWADYDAVSSVVSRRYAERRVARARGHV